MEIRLGYVLNYIVVVVVFVVLMKDALSMYLRLYVVDLMFLK